MALASEIMDAGLPAGVAVGINGGQASIAAAGTNQATATAINTSSVLVTGATGSNGVRLPAGMPGDSVNVFSGTATNALLVFPPVGAAIAVNGTGLGTANASFSQAAWKWATYTCFSSTQWFVDVSA